MSVGFRAESLLSVHAFYSSSVCCLNVVEHSVLSSSSMPIEN